MSKPLVLVSSSRSGTNYFLSVFKEMVPNSVVLREIFRPGGDNLPEQSALTGLSEDALAAMAQRDPVRLWEHVRHAAGDRPLALKIFYYHAASTSPIWPRLAKEARLVHLVRRRALDTLVSRELAVQTGQWMTPSDVSVVERRPKLRLDPDEVAAFIAQREAYVRTFRDRFQNADLHEVVYEDIAGDPRHCAKAISGLTGHPLPDGPLKLPIRKQNVWAIRDLVTNYDDIAAFDVDHF